ncbi:MAG: IS21 family transposase [Methanocalculus sp. MSAO_Arc2]|uniref:IS21 family transposase n=1 Tax=Methanocalculus sp. MSAO_Arc2 TaxID=2293855 RepID=UPI000FF4FA0F|nr:MAG: IS21 family transposase [Methanocalculus sp. MSAO_Arc2]
MTAYPFTARRIYREIQEKGYTGGYTILKDYIRTIRPQYIMPVILRFETPPGKQMQVDWGECGSHEIDGRKRKIYAFSAVLGYSRMRYMEFTLSTDVYTLIQCHKNAFDYFGGIPDEILYDNIKTVIIKRAIRAKDHTWNAKFEDFFTHYGFILRVCKPYNPQTKGKVENSIKFMKKDFLLGNRFTSYPDMNQKLLKWCNRVNGETHGSTHEIPYDRLKEEILTPLGLIKPYIIRSEETRKILRDAYFLYKRDSVLGSIPVCVFSPVSSWPAKSLAFQGKRSSPNISRRRLKWTN